jgi:hypothetical protein
MNSSSFLRADGTMARERTAWWREWLPTLDQIKRAIQLEFGAEPNTRTAAAGSITMRQGLGLVVVAGLLAGLLPFLINAVIAMRLGTALPLAQLAQQAQEQNWENGPLAQIGETWQTLAGLRPAVLPGWMAGLLTSLGEWINWPLRWLTWWLVYGAAVLLAAKVWHAPTTLQQFFSITSYAAVPMILTGLGPIPCLGALAQAVAVLWMLAVYGTSVRTATGLDWGRTAVAVILPGAVALLFAAILLLASATTVWRMVF